MGYSYFTPQQMSEKPGGGSVEYYSPITEPTTLAELRQCMENGRFNILEDSTPPLYHVMWTNYYYTEAGKLKINDETGAAVMVEPTTTWLVLTE